MTDPQNPTTAPVPITAEAVHKWGGWFVAIALFLITTTGYAVAKYFGAKAEVSAAQSDTAKLRTDVDAVTKRVDELEHDKAAEGNRLAALERENEQRRARDAQNEAAAKELLGRMRNVERFLAQLVCKQEGPGSAPCEKALAAIGP